MAGKKRRSRAGYKAKRAAYKSENRLAKNKERRQKTHQRRVAVQLARKDERVELLEKALEKTKLNSYQLARKYGTLNIKRLTDIVDGTVADAEWFKLRLLKQEETKNARKSKRVCKRESSVQVSKRGEKTKKVPGRRKGRD